MFEVSNKYLMPSNLHRVSRIIHCKVCDLPLHRGKYWKLILHSPYTDHMGNAQKQDDWVCSKLCADMFILSVL